MNGSGRKRDLAYYATLAALGSLSCPPRCSVQLKRDQTCTNAVPASACAKPIRRPRGRFEAFALDNDCVHACSSPAFSCGLHPTNLLAANSPRRVVSSETRRRPPIDKLWLDPSLHPSTFIVAVLLLWQATNMGSTRGARPGPGLTGGVSASRTEGARPFYAAF